MYRVREHLFFAVLYELYPRVRIVPSAGNGAPGKRAPRAADGEERTLASTVTSQLCASGGGIPVSDSSFHESQAGSAGELYVTGMFARDACGSQMRGVHVQRRPTYATPGGVPASFRLNGRNAQPPPSPCFFASTCHM